MKHNLMPAAPGDQQLPRPHEVFISYSRKDKDFVRRLDEALKSRGREAWVDWEDIRPTEEWMQAIYAAIEGADTFVFVLTPDSVASIVCGREIAHAAAHNKRMVPIVARDVNADTAPEALAKLNWIFFRESDDFEKANDTLVSALDTDLDWIRAHTRLLTRAIEWENKGKNNSFVLRGDDLGGAEQWLAQAGAEKERQPTPLQTEYIIASRKAAAQRQRIILAAVTCGAVVALILASVAWKQRTKAVAQEKIAIENAGKVKRTSVQADFDVALLQQQNSKEVSVPALAHLARALRTQPDATGPKEYLISLLRRHSWSLPQSEPLRHDDSVDAVSFSPDGRHVITISNHTARVWDAESGVPLGKPLQHDGIVEAASFSPDGQRIVTACSDNTARVWDARSGKPVGEPLRHEGSVHSAKFSPDGHLIVTASDDNTARIWDAESGNSMGEPLRHKNSVLSASFSPDGRLIATASSDSTARIWDAATGKRAGNPLPHKEEVYSANFSPDGRLIVTASRDSTAQVWDVKSCKPLGGPLTHNTDSAVRAASFSPDGGLIVTASKSLRTLERSPLGQIVAESIDSTAQIWEVESGKPLGEPLRHDGDIDAASFSPDGYFFVTTLGNMAQIWDVKTGKPMGEPLRHKAPVNMARFSPDGRLIITGSRDNTACVWQVESGTPQGEPLRSETGEIRTASFSANGQFIVTGERQYDSEGDGGTVRLWDVESGKPVGKPLRIDVLVQLVRFSPDGHLIVTSSADNTARVWDSETGKLLGQPLRHEKDIKAINFSRDGRRIVTASVDHSARVWNAFSGKPLGEPFQHDSIVVAASFSPDGRRILTVAGDEMARVWDVETGELSAKSPRHDEQVESAIFSPDGRLIATASQDGTARMWDVESGKQLGEPLRHEKGVAAVNFSPDGRRIITASYDNTARVWEVQSGQPVSEPLRHDGAVVAACFSPDGRRVVTASRDKIVRSWDVESGKPVSEPFLHKKEIESARFSADGRWLLTKSAGDWRIWDIAIDLDGPLPLWVPDLAEAVGAKQFDNQGALVEAKKSIVQLRKGLLALKGDDFWSRFGRWFVMRGPERTISPNSKMTVRDYIERCIEWGSEGSLDEAEKLAAGNAELLRRIAAKRSPP